MQLFLKDTDRIGCRVGEYGHNKSWLYWDIAKQYYMLIHPEESNQNYSLANPFTSEEKQKEIVYRHIGWEIFHYNNSDFQNRFYSSPDIVNLLNKNQLASYEYTELGKRICDLNS